MIYRIVVHQFSKMLGNLLAILDKAAAHAQEKNFDVDVLLQARLSPDQFNLIRQVQVACDTAKLGAAKLIDKEGDAPNHPDTEQSLAEVKARIQSVNHLSQHVARIGLRRRRATTHHAATLER